MNTKFFKWAIFLMVSASLVLTACGPKATPATAAPAVIVQTQLVPMTVVVEVTALPLPTEPTVIPTSVVQLEIPIVGVCPTEREFEVLTGVRADIVREEPCAFHWRGDPQTITAIHPCPDGWSCTLGSDDQNYVYHGDNNLGQINIFAGTWRLVSMYPSNDALQNNCSFLEKVQNEGVISDPQWTAEAGNFTCP